MPFLSSVIFKQKYDIKYLETNLHALQMLSDFGSLSKSVLLQMSVLLQGSVNRRFRTAVLKVLAANGTSGVCYILSTLQDGFSEKDNDILNFLLAIPSVKQHIILDFILHELESGQINKELPALLALGSMYEAAAMPRSLEALTNLLINSHVKKEIVAYILRSMGDTGETVLRKYCLDYNVSDGVRAACAWALGISLPLDKDYAPFITLKCTPGKLSS